MSTPVANPVRRRLAAAVLLLAMVCTGACRGGPDNAEPHASATAQRYHLSGQVVSVDVNHQMLTVKHGAIPGYMEAMTMPFNVPSRAMVGAAEPGSRIEATLVVDGDRSWLQEIALMPGDTGAVRASLAAGARLGDRVPDFTLVNQDGHTFSLAGLRGKAVALTFIYVRCPLPDFCPRLSRQFAAVERTLLRSPELRRATALVSVSFDPAFDTPEVLTKYRATYLGDIAAQAGNHWQCATGSPEQVAAIAGFFGLEYFADDGQFSHSLRTVVIAPDGRLTRVHPFNDWTADDLIGELREALQAPGGH